MKFYLFLCISSSLANQAFARNIEFLNTESILNSTENTVSSNSGSTSNSFENISTTTTSEPECPENMTSSPWRPMAATSKCYCGYPFLPLPVNNTCFELFKQEPCEPGNFLVQPLWPINGDLPMPGCTPNPCLENGLVPYNKTCHNIITHPLCERGLLYFREVSSELICQSLIQYHVLIEAPSRRKCPTGTREDRNGKCQKKL